MCYAHEVARDSECISLAVSSACGGDNGRSDARRRFIRFIAIYLEMCAERRKASRLRDARDSTRCTLHPSILHGWKEENFLPP